MGKELLAGYWQKWHYNIKMCLKQIWSVIWFGSVSGSWQGKLAGSSKYGNERWKSMKLKINLLIILTPSSFSRLTLVYAVSPITIPFALCCDQGTKRSSSNDHSSYWHQALWTAQPGSEVALLGTPELPRGSSVGVRWCRARKIYYSVPY